VDGTVTQSETRPARDPWWAPLVSALAAGCAVAVVIGVYSGLHSPSGVPVTIPGFSGPLYAKAWLTSLAALLAVVQLVSAIRIYRPGAPAWVATLHRWSGRSAVIVTLPVVVHCVYALGFETESARVLVHALLGCFFYGAFVSKMLILTRRGMPGWALPVVGGAVFTGLIGLWFTSAFWLFTTKGLRF
jgi:Family of unknown function (DUF6529)